MAAFSQIANHLLAGIIQREQDLGATITWAGDEYPCAGGATLGGKSVVAGGMRATAQATIVVRMAHFTNEVHPAEKQRIEYRETPASAPKSLRIDSVNSVFGALLVLECNDPNTGA